MQASEELLKFIAAFESPGGRPALKAVQSPEQPAPDGGIKYEIGFGHNSNTYLQVTADTVITEQQAWDLLRKDLWSKEQVLNRWLDKGHMLCNQHEYDGMLSALYNGVPLTNERQCGLSRAIKAYLNPAIFEEAREEASYKVCDEWERWVYATVNGQKVKLPGLVKRRGGELSIFLDGDYSTRP